MTDMREALEAAYAQHSGEETDKASPVGDETPKEDEGTGGGEIVEETSAGDTPTEQTDESESASAIKFLPAEEEPAAEAQPVETPVPTERAPAGWKGDAKGHWDDLPPSVQQEVLRREREMGGVTREAAAARGFQQDFQQLMAPYLGFIEADRSTPLQAVQNMMQTAATLRVGTAQQKAAVAADIIRRFDVNVNMVDDLLVGKSPSPEAAQQDQIAQYLDQRLAPVNQFMSDIQQAKVSRDQRLDQELDRELEELRNSEDGAYVEDVAEDMTDLLQMYSNRGQKLTYRQAYEKALAMHPELSSARAQKKAVAERQKQAVAQQVSLEKKKRASASVQGVPQGSNGATPPTDMREQLMAAWDAVESGGI